MCPRHAPLTAVLRGSLALSICARNRLIQDPLYVPLELQPRTRGDSILGMVPGEITIDSSRLLMFLIAFIVFRSGPMLRPRTEHGGRFCAYQTRELWRCQCRLLFKIEKVVARKNLTWKSQSIDHDVGVFLGMA
jgi:hypothetical protein